MPDPLATPAACFNKTDAGGVFRTKVKLLSSYTVISTGMMVPILSCVAALYSLQKAIMFTPCAPKAGPIGGDGLAFPAGMASLIYPDTAFHVEFIVREL